jgi:AcrR family transcriptional regulator
VSGGVKKSRPYDGEARRERSRQTRQRIVDAARALVLQHGYRRTTVAAVAQEAGVSVDTVYELVGRKPVLLRELIEQALSGTDHAVAAEDREAIRAVRDEPDAGAKIDLYARSVRRTQERLAPLFLALRDASSTEPEAGAVWREVADRRAANMRRFAADLRATGRLRPDLTLDEAADTVWAMNSSELYVLLTGDRGWSPDRYETWLADSWRRLLLS